MVVVVEVAGVCLFVGWASGFFAGSAGFAVPFAGFTGALAGFAAGFAGFAGFASFGKSSSGVEMVNPEPSVSTFACAACCAGFGL